MIDESLAFSGCGGLLKNRSSDKMMRWDGETEWKTLLV